MKSVAWLLLAVVLSFNTAGFAHPQSFQQAPSTSHPGPPELAQLRPLGLSIPGYNVVCENIRERRICVSVSDVRVEPGSYVTVYGMMRIRGEGVAGQIMEVVWSSKTTETCVGLTDESGIASCTTYVPPQTLDARKVYVKVWIDHFKLVTSFRTHVRGPDPESTD